MIFGCRVDVGCRWEEYANYFADDFLTWACRLPQSLSIIGRMEVVIRICKVICTTNNFTYPPASVGCLYGPFYKL